MSEDHEHVRAINAFATVVGANCNVIGPHVSLEWRDGDRQLGVACFVWDGPVFHWPHLTIAPDMRGAGIFRGLFGAGATEIWTADGVERMTCAGVRGAAWRWLEPVGFYPVETRESWMSDEWLTKMNEHHHLAGSDPVEFRVPEHLDLFVADLHSGCRFDEYRNWKDGDADEPEWHKKVAARKAQT